MNTLHCGRKELSLDVPRVMGILNITPDSFSDGGQFLSLDNALVQAENMLSAGVDIIDVGGESTRPGAQAVDVQQEIDRVVPVVEAISQRFDTVVSIDTSKAQVISAACRAGATFINDVRALREPGALEAAAASGMPVCLMHMQGEPRSMQQTPCYTDVVKEVTQFLESRRQACLSAGIAAGQVLVDPGFGFGKTLEHNLKMLRELHCFCNNASVLVGLSRKSMFASILGDEQADRTSASVTAALLCIQRGAAIVRVHDVEPTVHALAVYGAATTR